MTLAEQLLRDGIPPSLLIDLVDPEGMKAALASELLAYDVTTAPAPGADLTSRGELRRKSG